VRALLKRYAERIDNATLRERALLFAAVALVLVFTANALLIEPLRGKQRRLAAEITRHEGELRTVQAQVQRLAGARAADPEVRERKRAADLKAEVAALDARIGQEQRRFTTPQRMREVLEEMLERDRRLRLVDLKTLPVTELAASQGRVERRMFLHGLELTLAGSYLDLHAYLYALERMSTQLYWGKVEMQVTAYPVATLKLTVYTLSFDRAWLVV
jgi:MSHA biogenesis protein MshJ